MRTVIAPIGEVADHLEAFFHSQDYRTTRIHRRNGDIISQAKLDSSSMESLMNVVGRQEVEIDLKQLQSGNVLVQIILRSHPHVFRHYCAAAVSGYALLLPIIFNLMISLDAKTAILGPFLLLLVAILAIAFVWFIGFVYNTKTKHQRLCDDAHEFLAGELGAPVTVIQLMRGSFEVSVLPSLIIFTFPLCFVLRLNDPVVQAIFVGLLFLGVVYYNVGRPSDPLDRTPTPSIATLGFSFAMAFLGICPFFVWAIWKLPPQVTMFFLLPTIAVILMMAHLAPPFITGLLRHNENNTSAGNPGATAPWTSKDISTAALLIFFGLIQWVAAFFGFCSIWTLVTGKPTLFGGVEMFSLVRQIHRGWLAGNHGFFVTLLWQLLLASYWLLFFVPFCQLLYRIVSTPFRQWKDHASMSVPSTEMEAIEDISKRICKWARVRRPRIVLQRIGVNRAHVTIPIVPFTRCRLVLPTDCYGALPRSQFEALLAHEIAHIAHGHVFAISIWNFLSRWLLLGDLGFSFFYRSSTAVEAEADKFAVNWLESMEGNPEGRQALIDLVKELEKRRIEKILKPLGMPSMGISALDADGSKLLNDQMEQFIRSPYYKRVPIALRMMKTFYFEAWESVYSYLPLDARIKMIRQF